MRNFALSQSNVVWGQTLRATETALDCLSDRRSFFSVANITVNYNRKITVIALHALCTKPSKTPGSQTQLAWDWSRSPNSLNEKLNDCWGSCYGKRLADASDSDGRFPWWCQHRAEAIPDRDRQHVATVSNERNGRSTCITKHSSKAIGNGERATGYRVWSRSSWHREDSWRQGGLLKALFPNYHTSG